MPLWPVAIALGSNLGDRAAHLAYARSRLGDMLIAPAASPVIETEPVGPGAQGRYLNQVVIGVTALVPDALLIFLQRVEIERGRVRPFPDAPRTLDLDLILHGAACLRTASLALPHPRFRERRFVLEPLAAVAPRWRDVETGLTVAELLERLE